MSCSIRVERSDLTVTTVTLVQRAHIQPLSGIECACPHMCRNWPISIIAEATFYGRDPPRLVRLLVSVLSHTFALLTHDRLSCSAQAGQGMLVKHAYINFQVGY